MKLECCHADTCLPSYWGGHQRPHIQVVAYNGMTLPNLKRDLLSELSQGAVAGEYPDTDEWFAAAKQAVNDIQFNDPELRADQPVFTDLEEGEDDDGSESVYAFFVFMELED